MNRCVSLCSTSKTIWNRMFRIYDSKRCYSPMYTETTLPKLLKSVDGDVEKRKDPTMLQEVDIKDLPRAQRRHVEEFFKMSETRAIAMKKLNYKNLAAFIILLSFAVGIYMYTYSGLKQETFLEEIDEELAAELAEKSGNKQL